MGPTEHWFLIYKFILRCELAFYISEYAPISGAPSVNEKCMGKWELVADLPRLVVKIPQLNRLILEHCLSLFSKFYDLNNLDEMRVNV